MTIPGRENEICTGATCLFTENIGIVWGDPNNINAPHEHFFF